MDLSHDPIDKAVVGNFGMPDEDVFVDDFDMIMRFEVHTVSAVFGNALLDGILYGCGREWCAVKKLYFLPEPKLCRRWGDPFPFAGQPRDFLSGPRLGHDQSVVAPGPDR